MLDHGQPGKFHDDLLLGGCFLTQESVRLSPRRVDIVGLLRLELKCIRRLGDIAGDISQQNVRSVSGLHICPAFENILQELQKGAVFFATAAVDILCLPSWQKIRPKQRMDVQGSSGLKLISEAPVVDSLYADLGQVCRFV